jgi:glycine cleavage system H protein
MQGSFAGTNPALQADACIVKSDPYEIGWLYAAKGEPEEDSLDVHGYIEMLSATIQRMAEEGHGEEGAGELE